ncbi:hypothetical protein KKF81_06715 [Candidatus Micrarchaeota archaeon]|nr:hypothetical protein [Candidatus Micrarchaeota archaeon]MBU1166621.1 hypothetical protein [Candidatus Micrarchaeota archaeon]MBU1886652.1 hypothetical protein [Candidatus Micrarchaeota archaeon]
MTAWKKTQPTTLCGSGKYDAILSAKTGRKEVFGDTPNGNAFGKDRLLETDESLGIERRTHSPKIERTTQVMEGLERILREGPEEKNPERLMQMLKTVATAIARN